MQVQNLRKIFHTTCAFLLFIQFGVTQAQQAGLLYDPEPPLDSAYVRIIVASREGPVDVVVDGRQRLQKLASGEASEFMVLSAGAHTIALHPAGKSTATLSTQLDVAKGRALTVAFPTLKANTAPLLIEDKTNSNKLKALLAIYHLDSKTGTIDILTADGATKVLSNITPGSAATIQVNPIEVQLIAVKTGEKSALAKTSLKMTQGGTYSVFLMSGESGKMIAKVGLNKIERYTGK
jgi:alginate O-acetyltransferase complex protein AlgF